MGPVTLDGRLALPVDQAARSLGVSVATLRRMMRSGQVASFMIRRRRLVPAAEVVRLAGLQAGRDAAGRA